MSYAIVAYWTATEGEEEAVADLLRQLASLSRTEAGCQLYRSHRSTDDPRSFMIYEVYDDAEALEPTATASTSNASLPTTPCTG